MENCSFKLCIHKIPAPCTWGEASSLTKLTSEIWLKVTVFHVNYSRTDSWPNTRKKLFQYNSEWIHCRCIEHCIFTQRIQTTHLCTIIGLICISVLNYSLKSISLNSVFLSYSMPVIFAMLFYVWLPFVVCFHPIHGVDVCILKLFVFFYIFILRLLRVEYGKRKSWWWWWWIVETIHKLLQYYQLQLHIFTIYSHVNVACVCFGLYGCWASLHQIRKISIYTNVFYLFTRPNLVVFYLFILCEFLNQKATLQV